MAREHGTHARYVVDRCRCAPCKAANTTYENHRARMIAYGRWQPYVDAEPIRRHVRGLMSYGIGWQRIARLSGVPNGSLSKLLYGGPGSRPPSKGVRSETALKLLAIEPSPDLLGATVSVDSTGTRRRLQALVAAGWSQSKLAGRLGMLQTNFSRMVAAPAVYADTARKVAALYDELWDQQPPEDGHRDKVAASRARNMAASRGWPPPLAWDDDTIDDPTARPDLGAKVSRREALAENAEELIVGQGYTLEQAAERLGVTAGYLKEIRRSSCREVA